MLCQIIIVDTMENDKKVGIEEELPIKQPLDVNKRPTLFGSRYPRKPKEYICSNCGKITAADVLWKVKSDINEPFCGKCGEPVVQVQLSNS